MLDGAVEFLVACSKELFQIAVIVVVAVMVGGYLWGQLVAYDKSLHPTPTVNPAAFITPSVQPGTPTVTLIPMSSNTQTITSDLPDLRRNKQYPVTFTRNTNTDPKGAYFATLNFNGPAGDFPSVYLNVQEWRAGGGRIIKISDWPTLGLYYTVYTYKGTSQQLLYDRHLNVIYSMVDNPTIL
jgi:hypothetical protein